jgi:fibronectin type 3 domain-containing protein
MRSSIVSRITQRGTLIVAATLLAIVNCEQLEVTTISAARVELLPQNVTVPVSQSARLTATVLSSEGKTLTGRAIDWISLQENIASVDNTGLVRGMTAGVATIRAESGDAAGTATITVTAAPSLSLTPSEVNFSAVQNGATPGDRTVTVMNGGTGTLGGISAAVRYGAGEPTAWLTASLATNSAPTALILVANQGNFAPGTYNATVDVASSTPGVATRSVTVRFAVVAPAPAIGLGAITVAFSAAQGGANSAAQQVGVTNAGGGSLTGLATTIDYQAGQPTGWLTASLSGTTAPAQLTLQASPSNTPAGNYTANVRVTSPVAQNNPQTVTVNFAVAPAQATLALSQQSLSFFASRGGSNPSSQTVQVTSLNSTQIAGLTFAITYGSAQPTGWASAALSAATTPANLTVNGATGSLQAGMYTATLTVLSPNATNGPQAISLSLQVVDPTLSPPTALSATANSPSQIDLAWTPPATGSVARYRIERKTGAGGTYAIIDSTTSTSYQNVGLSPATQYFYRVSACNATNCSPPSTEANATTSQTAPGVPTNVSATPASATQIDVSWSAASGTVNSYVIDRKPAGGTYTTAATLPKDSLVYRNTGLSPATQYYYQVRACNTVAGCSNPSVEVNATTFTPPPSAPSGLSATVISATQVDLSWTASASGTVTIYRIERQDPGNSFQEIAQVGAGTTTYSSNGLSGSTQYNYRVRACNQGGCSGYSNSATAITPVAPPNLTALVASSSQIDLSWSASKGATYYVIERQIVGPFIQIAMVTGTAYSDMGLNSGTQYSYRVKACNVSGCSLFSAPVSASPH